MALMSQNPQDQMEQAYKMAPPVDAYASAAPVDPHLTLTAPIGPPAPEPVTMAPGGGKMSGKSEAPSEGKKSLLEPQEEHINSKLMSDYQKDADPYGSPDNHPGFFGKLLHGLNVATGGVNRRGFEEKGLEGRLQNLSKEESAEGLQGAQAGNQTAQAGKATEETNEAPQKAADTHAQSQALTGEADARTDALRNPPDTNPDMATYRSLVKLGMRPSEALQEIEKDKALALKPPGMEHVDLTGPNGKPMGANYSPTTGQYTDTSGKVIANPQPYQKPNQAGMVTVIAPDPNNPGGGIVERVGAGSHLAPGSMTASQYGQGAATEVKQDQAAQKAREDAGKELHLAEQLVAQPSPTNDLALVMRYIGATKPDSLGKLRLNNNEVNLVYGTRSTLGNIDALVQKVQNGQSLIPQQRKDMLNTMRVLAGYHYDAKGPHGPGWYQ